MGSLNGDLVVMRNGRCTSQVSVYNYPEHLNPFYEDDQHKRLRFWSLNKKGEAGRRNSISFSNLKDMWGFKSFRLKKKSSTLGINKTSESPPPLRRQQLQHNGWNTLDYRVRPSSHALHTYSDNIQRNTISRSSFQSELIRQKLDRSGFNRNDNYRSTIQVGGLDIRGRQQPQQSSGLARYVYRGSMTPQPLRNTDTSGTTNEYNNNNYLIKGSSRTSVISTNPFENDNENDNDSIKEKITEEHNLSPRNTKKQIPHKKRRAPAPPTPVSTPVPETLIKSSQNNIELRIAEDNDIANLTAEIEYFVQTKNNANVEREIMSNRKSVERAVLHETKVNIENKCSENNDIVSTLEEHTPLTVESSAGAKSAQSSTTTTIRTKDGHHNIEALKHTDRNDGKDCKQNVLLQNNTIAQKPPTVNIAAVEQKMEKLTSNATPHICTTMTSSVKDFHSNESEQLEKPIPVKRRPKPDTQGHHEHVSAQKSPARPNYIKEMRTFKPDVNNDIFESITAKTSFILTSPPSRHHKTRIVEDVTINKVERNQQILDPNNIKSDNSSERVSLKKSRENLHSFAEIHRPMRTSVKKNNREELPIPPKPTIPDGNFEEYTKEESPPNDTILNSTHAANNALQIVKSVTVHQDEKYTDKVIANQTTERFELDSVHRPRTSLEEWKHSTLAPLETNVPPEKRKSVKDIIESINRSQRILNAAANKDFPVWPDRIVRDSNDLSSQSSNINVTDKSPRAVLSDSDITLNESERELQRVMAEIESMKHRQLETLQNQTYTYRMRSLSPRPPHRDVHKVDNNEIIQKCTLNKEAYDHRESSPISSNLDWNPLPKPKRVKPITEGEN